MSLEPRGIIRDQIHGFIQINKLEYQLIQHPFLRRLHNIKQLGMAHLVFPGATHTRFNHSLGVMHVAGRMGEILAKQARRGELCGHFFLHCDKSIDDLIEVARLAGLLHDLGHPPLSHQVELSLVYADRKRVLRENAPSLVAAAVGERGGSLHEAFTRHFVLEIAEAYESEGLSDVALYVRAAGAVLGAVEASVLEELGLRDEAVSVLSSMISGPIFDADRLDYLVRDARMSGVVFGDIDIERLLLGLQLELEEDREGRRRVVLGVHPRSLQTLEDIFDARYKMYKTVYYHHKLIAINVAITRIVELLMEHWDRVAPRPLLEGLSGPNDLYSPKSIARLILDGYTLYTDSDFDQILYNMATSRDDLLRRWAVSLLSERSLLPISVAKRPDALVIEAAKRAGVFKRESTIDELFDIIVKLHNEGYQLIIEGLRRKAYEIASTMGRQGISQDDIVVEALSERIVKSNLTDEESPLSRSLYLYFIGKLGGLILLYPYVYSDDRDIHLSLYKGREEIRRRFKSLLEEAIRSVSRS